MELSEEKKAELTLELINEISKQIGKILPSFWEFLAILWMVAVVPNLLIATIILGALFWEPFMSDELQTSRWVIAGVTALATVFFSRYVYRFWRFFQ